MIVEAMKTMNHVPSTNDGVVEKILSERWAASRIWSAINSFEINKNVQKVFNS